MGCQIAISFPRELNAVMGDELFSRVMNGIRVNDGMVGILSRNTDQAIDKLTSGDVNALALVQF